jgi:riboflavin synthase
MFTGIIEEVGRVTSVANENDNRRLTVSASHLVKELKKGDSIAVSGVCLTAVDITPKSFGADLAEETWNRTSFSRIKPELTRYVIFKGSLSIEGISLTVAKVEGTQVTVAVIPHTTEMTNLKSIKPGDPVNLEVDMIAKYVEKMMRGDSTTGSITIERLVQEGF